MFGLGRHGNDGKGGQSRAAVRRILIVEDEPLVAFDNEHVLQEAGYVVVGAVDRAADAERLIAAGGIDLVLADIRLRGATDGIHVARAAKDAGIAVMFVTGACPPEARSLAVGCLAKPFSARDLIAAIELVSAKLAGAKPARKPRAFTLFD